MSECAVPRLCLVTLVLGMTLFLPSLLRAGTITLAIPPGAAHPIDSFGFGVQSTVTFTMPESVFVNEFQNVLESGRRIPTMILTETMNGVTEKFTFTGNFVTSIVIGAGTSPTADVAVRYSKLTITTTTPTPEPSSLILLGTGLFGLIGLRRRFA